jgi:hypothetical protein
MPLVKRCLDNAVLLQQFQPAREDVGRDVLGGREKLLKFGASEQHISDDQQTPAITDQVQGTSDRALRSPQLGLILLIHVCPKISKNNSLANKKSLRYCFRVESDL